jgi:hypothetical protein
MADENGAGRDDSTSLGLNARADLRLLQVAPHRIFV